MATAIGDLVVNLAANTRRFDSSMRRAQGQVNSFSRIAVKALAGVGAAVGAYLGTRAINRFIGSQMRAIDATSKLADRLGMSTEFVQAMGFAAEQSGMSIEEMRQNLQMFSRRIGEAVQGTGEGIQALERLGLSARDLDRMMPEDALRAVAQAISEISSPAEQAALAADLFGRSGTRMLNLLKGGAKGIDDFVAQSERLGITFSRDQGRLVEQANDAWNRFKRAVGGVGIQIAIGLAPALRKASDWLTSMIPSVLGVMRKIGEFGAAVRRITGVIVSAVADRIAPVWRTVSDAAGSAFSRIGQLVRPAIDTIIQLLTPVIAAGMRWQASMQSAAGAVSRAIGSVIGAVRQYASGVLASANVTGTFRRGLAAVIDLWSSIQDVVMSVTSTVITAVADVVNAVFSWVSASGTAEAAGRAVGSTWQTVMDSVIDTIEGLAFTIRNFSDIAQVAFIDIVVAGLRRFPQLEEPITRVVATFVGAWEGAKAFFSAFIDNIIGGFQEMKNVVVAITEGIKAAIDAIMSGAVGDAASAFAAAFTKTLAEQTGPAVRNPFAEMTKTYAEARDRTLKQFEEQGGLTNTLENKRQQALDRIARREEERRRSMERAARQTEDAMNRVGTSISRVAQSAAESSDKAISGGAGAIGGGAGTNETQFAAAMGRGSAEAFSTIISQMTGKERKPERSLLTKIARYSQRQTELAERAAAKERQVLVEIPT